MRNKWTWAILAGTLVSATGAHAAALTTDKDVYILASEPLTQWRGGNDRNDDDRGNRDRDNDRRDNDRRDNDRRGSDWRDRNRSDNHWNDNDRYRQRGGYYGGIYPGGGYSYGVPRYRERDDNRSWDNGWRRDDRYNWSDYRRRNGDLYRYGTYANPYGNRSYSRFRIGLRVGAPYYNSRYWIGDPWRYRLPPVYGSYRWVRYYNDVLLIDTRTGYVQDAVYGFFW